MNDATKGKTQKIFVTNLIVSLLTCLLLIIWLVLSLFSIVQIESQYVLVITIVPVIFFVLCNLVWRVDRVSNFQFPKRLPKKIFKALPGVAIILYLILMVYGSAIYPTMPIRHSSNTFRDKIGNEYTLEQFQDFQNWESAFMISVAILLLPLAALLPFYDKNSRTWKY